MTKLYCMKKKIEKPVSGKQGKNLPTMVGTYRKVLLTWNTEGLSLWVCLWEYLHRREERPLRTDGMWAAPPHGRGSHAALKGKREEAGWTPAFIFLRCLTADAREPTHALNAVLPLSGCTRSFQTRSQNQLFSAWNSFVSGVRSQRQGEYCKWGVNVCRSVEQTVQG